MGVLLSIVKWIGAFVLEKLFVVIQSYVSNFFKKREQEQTQAEVIKKQEEVINNPSSTDEELANAAEDVLNNRKR